MYVCVCMFVCMCIHTYTHTHTHTHTHTYIMDVYSVYIHICIHTYTHTYTYIPTYLHPSAACARAAAAGRGALAFSTQCFSQRSLGGTTRLYCIIVYIIVLYVCVYIYIYIYIIRAFGVEDPSNIKIRSWESGGTTRLALLV